MPQGPLFVVFVNASGKIFEEMRVLARQGLYSSQYFSESVRVKKSAQPPWRDFQAVIKSAASAASPRTKNPRKSREK